MTALIAVIVPICSGITAHNMPPNVSITNNRVIYISDIERILDHRNEKFVSITDDGHPNTGRIVEYVKFIIKTRNNSGQLHTYNTTITTHDPVTITLKNA